MQRFASPPLQAVREATDEEILAILGWTHPLWADGRDFPAYEVRWNRLLETPWGRTHFRFMVGLDQAGQIGTTCKRYRFDLLCKGKPVKGVGFGAIYTPESSRGRGYAAALQRTIMAEESDCGAEIALLYSDIGARYYNRLGFVSVGAQEAEATAVPGELVFRAAAAADGDCIAAWSAPPGDVPLAFARNAEYWAFLLERRRPELLVYAPPARGASPEQGRGFAAIRVDGDAVSVQMAGHDQDVDPAIFWFSLRSLAASRGAAKVVGWLPPAAAAAGFAYRPLTAPLPMAAALAGNRMPTDLHLWSIDYF